MNKPDDIPQDVLVAARQAVLPQYDTDMASASRIIRGEADTWPVVKVAVRAILAERERCAAVIEGFEQSRHWIEPHIFAGIRLEMAAEIRKGAPYA